MYQLPIQPLSIFQVIRQSFCLYRAAFKKILLWTILIALSNTILNLIMYGLYGDSTVAQMTRAQVLSSLVLTVLFLIAQLMLVNALITSIWKVMHNKTSEMKAEFAVGLRCWWRILLCIFMLSIILGIVSAAMCAMYSMMRTPTASFALVMLIALASLAVALAIIYFAVIFFA